MTADDNQQTVSPKILHDHQSALQTRVPATDETFKVKEVNLWKQTKARQAKFKGSVNESH